MNFNGCKTLIQFEKYQDYERFELMYNCLVLRLKNNKIKTDKNSSLIDKKFSTFFCKIRSYFTQIDIYLHRTSKHPNGL